MTSTMFVMSDSDASLMTILSVIILKKTSVATMTLRLDSFVLNKLNTFTCASNIEKLEIEARYAIKFDNKSFKNKNEMCERRESKERCELDVESERIEAKSKTCANVFAICNCDLDTIIIKNVATLRRLLLFSTMLTFLSSTLKFFCLLTRFIAIFSKLLISFVFFFEIDVSIVQNSSAEAILSSFVVVCELTSFCNNVFTSVEKSKYVT